MQSAVKSWIIEWSVVLGGLGGLACILMLFDIKPKDVRMNPPHWVWLVGAVILFSFNTWRSFRPSARKRARLKLAGVIESKAGQAEWLARSLDRVWHAYHNENEKLLRPLAEHTIPDPPTKNCERLLLVFRNDYRGHVGGTKYHLPEFHSDILDGKPFRNIEYVDLMHNLKEHATKLHELAEKVESSW
jgi:hypothetical protein